MMPVDKKTLKQYRALLKEQTLNDKAIDRLYDRATQVPTVMGKVVGSSHDFPYIEVRSSVQIDEPKEADEIERRLRIRKERQEQIRSAVIEIEQYIAEIPDSDARQIFEMAYIDGRKQHEIADELGYSRGRIPQIINQYLKD
mgnify:FL=1